VASFIFIKMCHYERYKLMSFIEEVKTGKALLLDVRTDAEWNEGHAEGALHLDSVRIESGDLPRVPKDTKIYTYCRSGGRAGRMKTILKNAGFMNVENLGGLIHWQSAGGKVVR
jgi:rhodanese-related sulfurtransferase